MLHFLEFFTIFSTVLFEMALANQQKLNAAIILYQEQQMRPCTLITILNQNRNDQTPRLKIAMEMLLDNPEFQFLTWNIDSISLNKTFTEDKRNFIFSSGCTIFIVEENLVSRGSVKHCNITQPFTVDYKHTDWINIMNPMYYVPYIP